MRTIIIVHHIPYMTEDGPTFKRTESYVTISTPVREAPTFPFMSSATIWKHDANCGRGMNVKVHSQDFLMCIRRVVSEAGAEVERMQREGELKHVAYVLELDGTEEYFEGRGHLELAKFEYWNHEEYTIDHHRIVLKCSFKNGALVADIKHMTPGYARSPLLQRAHFEDLEAAIVAASTQTTFYLDSLSLRPDKVTLSWR